MSGICSIHKDYHAACKICNADLDALDKWLHENVMKECWHDGKSYDDDWYCTKCGVPLPPNQMLHVLYSRDDTAYMKLLRKVGEDTLVSLYQGWKKDNKGFRCFTWMMLDPICGCQAIKSFFEEGAVEPL